MREIKFRAWDKKKKEMLYDGIEFYMRSIGCCPAQPNYKSIIGFDGCDCFDIMQFTGLHDKNGKEIYEGDIIGFKNKPPFTDLSCEVVFDEDVAAFAFHNYDISRHTFFYELPDVDYEIISNIHEDSSQKTE